MKVVAACLYRSGGLDFEQARAQAQAMSASERGQVIEDVLAQRGDFDVPLRELEHTTLTFDCVMDQGAYFDVKRHRVMTQTPQPLSIDLGYAVPQVIVEAGFAAEYDRAQQAAAAGLSRDRH